MSDYSPGVNITVSRVIGHLVTLQIKYDGFCDESVGSPLRCLTSIFLVAKTNQSIFSISQARFSPVSSLVYVLSAFDKVYRSHSFQSYDVSPESSSRLELGAASMSASGLYTCLVTGGDIPFLEDSDSKTVMVASKSSY